MEIVHESKVVAPNVFKSGLGLLFREDVKKYLTDVRDIIYPDFGSVSGIILSYLSIRLPENIKNNKFVGDMKLHINYEHMKDHGFPILESKDYNMEDFMMYLDATAGLSFCGMYYLNDIGMYFYVVLDESKISNYGYNKFSIKLSKVHIPRSYESAIKKTILNLAFISTNDIDKTHIADISTLKYFLNRPQLYSKSIMRFNNPISNSIIHILNCSFPAELKSMIPDKLSVILNTSKIIVAPDYVNIRAYEKKKGDFEYKSNKYLLPDALIRKYRRFNCYIIYFNKYHFVIELS